MRDASTYRAARRHAWRKAGERQPWPTFNAPSTYYQIGSLPADYARADINYLKKIYRGTNYALAR